MKSDNYASISDLLNVLSESLSPDTILSAQVKAEISTQIAKIRIRQGLTQCKFAELAGVKQTQVSRWESDDYNFTIDALAQIAIALNIGLQINFIEGVEPPKTVTTKKDKYYIKAGGDSRTFYKNNVIDFSSYNNSYGGLPNADIR